VFTCGDPSVQVTGCDPASPTPATSYRNQVYGNKMGVAPNGGVQRNGLDFWWDQGGITPQPNSDGNCWYGNTGTDGTAASVTGLPSPSGVTPDNLPSDCNNSPEPGSLHGQVDELLACSGEVPDSPSCPWFTTPPKP
jgi:hypothetical protein